MRPALGAVVDWRVRRRPRRAPRSSTAPSHEEDGGGSSIGGLRGNGVIGAYGMSKAADFILAKNLAVEHGPSGIRVNCVAPGLVKTDFARALWEDEKAMKFRNAMTPLRRIGQPDEIAGAAVFLASRAGSFTTGQTLVIDGGGAINQGG